MQGFRKDCYSPFPCVLGV